MSIIGVPSPFIRYMIRISPDELMKEFIGKLPPAFVSTRDADGSIDISPNGDQEVLLSAPAKTKLPFVQWLTPCQRGLALKVSISKNCSAH